MHMLKQGMAAVAFVASLGLVMPSAFGGSASADPVPYPGGTTEPERTFNCTIGGVEVTYDVVSQGYGKSGFHDVNSTTVFTVSYDQKEETYYPVFDTTDPDAPMGDEVVPITYPIRYTNKGKKLGQHSQIVPCEERYEEDNITAEGAPLVKDAHYNVDVVRTWYVTLSGDGQGAVKGASADDGGQHRADHSHKHKDGGKHQGKGKRGH